MKTLVTGGRGFLARVVAAHLRDHDHDVTVLTRAAPATVLPDGVRIAHADIRDRAGLRDTLAELDGPFQAVAHLAGLGDVRASSSDPLTYFDVNATGTLNLLRALHDLDEGEGVRPALVLASTQTVYGINHATATTEDLPVRPPHPYAASKLAAEHIVTSHAATGAISATVFRLVNLAGAVGPYGDHQRRGIVPKALAAAAAGEPVPVNGDGSTVRDYVHVADVADAVRRAIETTGPGDHRTYNIGSGHGASVTDILRAAEEVTGRPITIEHRPPVDETPYLVVNPRRARDELGWNPARSRISTIVDDAWAATADSISRSSEAPS